MCKAAGLKVTGLGWGDDGAGWVQNLNFMLLVLGKLSLQLMEYIIFFQTCYVMRRCPPHFIRQSALEESHIAKPYNCYISFEEILN